MTKFSRFGLALFLSMSYAFAGASQVAVMDLQNIQCYGCMLTVQKALQTVRGVEDTKLDLDRKTATVKFDPAKTNTEALVKATKDAGFPATIRK